MWGDLIKIGVLLREKEDCYSLNKEVNNIISKYNCSLIGITSYDVDILKMVDGFILQGGIDYTMDDMRVIDYLYKNNIPTLGICLGMQSMGVYKNGRLCYVKNHKCDKKYVHEVKIDTNSKLYDIIKKDRVVVNSRHNEALLFTDMHVVAKTLDGVIEGIEDTSKKFFIGLQWHPESLDDVTSKRIFDAFFNSI